ALSRILNLIVNVNKLNPMRAGSHFEVPREIMLKKAVVSVKSMDNACFAWSVVAALYPAKNHVDRKSSYPHYTTVLNLTNIEFPMTLKDISKFYAMLKHTRVRFELLTDIDSPTGYILEIDLEYPQHLHDRHTDLPFCPTRDKPPGKREDKLLATLYDKQRYVIHYRNLQQCTRHGLRVTKIHRVLQFAQSPWLRDYIELNTQFRTRAKNNFDKNLYKLMNNAVFGKTMENVRNHVDVKLVTKWDG
ncbi:hypothetical protein ALC57_11582, partial [Trachymyrmex cornetzi]